MTYKEVKTMVDSVGLPTAYYQFPNGTAQEPPFICFFFTDSNDFAADNKNYAKIRPLSIELYTTEKDFAFEAEVEAVLEENELVYTREEVPLDSERMYMVTYLTNIVIEEEISNG